MLAATAYRHLYHFRQSLEPYGVYSHRLEQTVVPWTICAFQIVHESLVRFFADIHF
jgi:hypothetical protein